MTPGRASTVSGDAKDSAAVRGVPERAGRSDVVPRTDGHEFVVDEVAAVDLDDLRVATANRQLPTMPG
jgi:hypothetical protein